jgi:hypothetical protein
MIDFIPYKLLNWINMDQLQMTHKVCWNNLSSNPNAIHILENNFDKIDWDKLSGNPNAIHILEKNLDKINWDKLSENPNAIDILRIFRCKKQNIYKINFDYLFENSNAMRVLRALESPLYNKSNQDPQNDYIISDTCKHNWVWLSENPNAIHILEQNLDKVNWIMLSKNPNAIHILEKNLDKVNWIMLSKNPNAIHILEKNQDKVNWMQLLLNPNIFTYDYEFIKKRNSVFQKNLNFKEKTNIWTDI